MDRKRVRRGESFGRMGLDRTISNSLKSPSRQKQKQLSVSFAEETPMIYLCSNFEPDMSLLEKDQRKKELWYSVRTHVGNMIILLARERRQQLCQVNSTLTHVVLALNTHSATILTSSCMTGSPRFVSSKRCKEMLKRFGSTVQIFV